MVGRSLTILCGAVLALAALVGCSSVTESGAVVPKAGSCTEIGTDAEMQASSVVRAPVRCAASHTSETYAVRTDAAEANASRPPVVLARSRAAERCGVEELRRFLGAGERDGLLGPEIRVFLPTVAQWAEGERWMRCEVVVVRDGVVQTRIATLRGAATEPALRRCYVQKPKDGRWETTGRVVTCDQPHTSQDVNAWVRVSENPTVTDVEAACRPYVTEALGRDPGKDGLHVTGVVRASAVSGTQAQCAIGGDPSRGNLDGVIATDR